MPFFTCLCLYFINIFIYWKCDSFERFSLVCFHSIKDLIERDFIWTFCLRNFIYLVVLNARFPISTQISRILIKIIFRQLSFENFSISFEKRQQKIFSKIPSVFFSLMYVYIYILMRFYSSYTDEALFLVGINMLENSNDAGDSHLYIYAYIFIYI